MKYSDNAFTKALSVLDKRRVDALTRYENNCKEIEVNAPEIFKIHKNLLETGFQISKLILSKVENFEEKFKEIEANNLENQEKLKVLLKEFNYPENFLDLTFTCSRCEDSGYVNGIRCECFEELLKKFSTDELNENCNILLNDFSDFKLSYYPDAIDINSGKNIKSWMECIYNYCFEYAEDFSKQSPSLLFLGNTGLGKTFLSSAIAKAVMEKGYSVVFDSVFNILRKIEDEHFGRTESNDTMDLIIKTDLLIIDDLGSEFSSEFYRSVLYNIINSRINLGLPMIISTNLTFSELQSKYDDRIVSRITGMFEIHKFLGTDIRQIKKRTF